MINNFQQRKSSILSKSDKSSIGSWDKKISQLCKKINSNENFYTTSSCSGRIIIMQDQNKKGPGLFEFVSHDLVKFSEFKKFLDKIYFNLNKKITSCNSPSTFKKIVFGLTSKSAKDFSEAKSEARINRATPERANSPKANLKFKSEPPILHIACKTLKDAESILEKSQKSGWKRSGIISLNKNIIVEIISTEKLEFPLTKNGELLVDKNFLKIALEKSNENLKKGWKKINDLKKLI